MAKTKFTSVDEVHRGAAEGGAGGHEARAERHPQGRARSQEAIWYQIPTYRLHGRSVIYFAGWKEHYSIYPSTRPLVAAFEKALEPYDVNDKGTIRFPLSQPVPVKLIEGLAKFRAKEVIAERASKTKAAARKR